MAKCLISLPDDLKIRMDIARDYCPELSWSPVAVDAFEVKLASLNLPMAWRAKARAKIRRDCLIKRIKEDLAKHPDVDPNEIWKEIKNSRTSG